MTKQVFTLFCIISFFLLLSNSFTLNAQVLHTFNGQGDGTNWHDNANWDQGGFPRDFDDVAIPAGFAVVISDQNTQARKVSIEDSASLTIVKITEFDKLAVLENATLTVNFPLTVSKGGDLIQTIFLNLGTVENNAVVTVKGHAINFGMITNNGSFFVEFDENNESRFINKNTGIINNFFMFTMDNFVNEHIFTNHANGTFTVFNTLINTDAFVNHGILNANDKVTNKNQPTFNKINATITNTGTINLNGDLDNEHIITNEETGIITGAVIVTDNALLLTSLDNNGTLTNHGLLRKVGIFTEDIFLNKANGNIQQSDIQNTALFENEGKIEIGYVEPTFFSNSIFNGASSVFKNKSTGIIECLLPISDPLSGNLFATTFIINGQNAVFENEGMIKANLESHSNPNLDILLNAGSFKNLVGATINFTGTNDFTTGILNKNNFENAGTISIGNAAATVKESGIINQDTFINKSTGTITINNTEKQAILNEGFFENQGGDISIGIAEEVNLGIQNEGTFRHLSESELGAFLRIEKTTKEGILITSNATFVNQSILRVGESPNGNIGAAGIRTQGELTNQATGEILIENVTENTAAALRGNLTNFGKVTIKNAASSLQNFGQEEIVNEACGKISIDNTLEITAIFTNNGFFEVVQPPTIPHRLSEGIFTNNAILEDVFKTINLEDITNNGIYIDPDFTFVDHDPVVDLFEVGNFEGNYTFGPEVTKDNDDPVGNFEGLRSIDLINPLPTGMTNLNFIINDNDGECFENVTFPLEVFPLFNCTTDVTNATNGQNNGSIDLSFEGGTFPIEFFWVSETDTFTTSNLSNIGPGEYSVTLTDASNRVTTCSANVGMVSQPKTCGDQTIFWDGGVILENGSPTVDDNGDIIFQGDGQNWSDPFNWSTDAVPTANDVVGASQASLGSHGEDRDKITLNIDATIESGGFGLELTIPSGNRLTFTCQLSFLTAPKINGTLKGNDATLKFLAGGIINEGTIDMTGNGANQTVIEMNGQLTNNGDIIVNNKAKGRGSLISGGSITNTGSIFLVNGQSGYRGNLLNQASGMIDIESTNTGLSGDIENFGRIDMGFNPISGTIETGIQLQSLFNGAFTDNLFNRANGIIDIREAEIGIALEPKDSVINQGFIQIGNTPNTRTSSAVQTGIISKEGVFINEATLNIGNFTEKGIHNMPNPAQTSANKKVATFVNTSTGIIDIAGNLTSNGATIAEFGVINENSKFHNEGDLLIKDIRKTGIDNFAHQANQTDIANDEFLNTGTLTLNFIGLGVNNAAAQGIQNRQNATFTNDGDMLIGTIKGNITVGGKIKGVGIYANTIAAQGFQDTSKFVNKKLIKIDNIISGGDLDEIDTGHGILSRQRSSRAIAENPNFINEGDLFIGGHKAVKNSGIRLENASAFLGTQQVFLNSNNGTIVINQTGQHGVHLGGQRLPAIFHNDGKMDIGTQVTVGGNGILVDNGLFKQFPNRTMSINATKGHGIEVRGDIKDNRNFNAIFENEGEILIGNAARIDGNGLLLAVVQKQKSTNEAQFNNRSTGILSIDRVEKSGIKLEERLAVNDGEVKLSNENIIVIGTNTPANDAFPEHGIDAKKGIITQTDNASLVIDNVQGHGFRLEKETTSLRGMVDIGTTHGIGEDGIHLVDELTRIFDRSEMTIKKTGGNGIFVMHGAYSNLAGDLKIEETDLEGILVSGDISNFNDNAIFTNAAAIQIEENGSNGILVEKRGEFENDGTVTIQNSSTAGIFIIERGVFKNNEGTLVIIEDCEIGIQNSGEVRNFEEATILISGFQVGIFNINNTNTPLFLNNGIVDVRNAPTLGTDICLANQGTASFVTDNCGETLFFGKFINPMGNFITNRGFFRLRPVTNNIELIVNQGAFENNGVVEDPDLRLDGNSITNNEILLHPSCFGDGTTGVIKNPVQFGANGNFTLAPTWTVDGSGNGAFSKVNSEVIFAAPRPNGSFLATLSATQNNPNSCILEGLEIRLSMQGKGNGINTNAGADQLGVCDTMVTLAANIPPAGATGTWSFINAGDGQGVFENINSPTSKFMGTLGQSYTLQWRLLADCGSGTDQVIISFDGDADNDTVCDSQDQCPGGDDRIDFDENGIPDDCEENNNEPCTENDLMKNENPIAAGTYQAVQTITSAGTVANNTEVIFKAGSSITLQAGFQAVAGSNFTVTIEACPATFVKSKIRSNQQAVESLAIHLPKAKIFPNPVQTQAAISIMLPKEQAIQLDIYSLNGQKMTTIIPNVLLAAGTHLFEWSCNQVEAGMYLVVLNGQVVEKMVVLK